MKAENGFITSGTIRFLTGQLAGKSYQLTKPVIYLGCGRSNDIIIPDLAAAYHHAQMRWHKGEWRIKRLSQRHTLEINGYDEEEAALRDNDVVGLGERIVFRFSIDSKCETQVTPQKLVSQLAPPKPLITPPIDVPQRNGTRIVAARPVPQHLQTTTLKPMSSPLPSSSISVQLTLKRTANLINYGDTETVPSVRKELVSNGNGHHKDTTLIKSVKETEGSLPGIHPIPLDSPVITIGRAPDNVVVLDHPQVSAHHARLDLTDKGYCIIDHGSTNHVYVNGQGVTQCALVPGDEIRIGPFKLTYTGTELIQQNESHGIRIDASGLYKEGDGGRVLLHDISLVIPPSKFVALVGGSGTGKSMLMDALNGLRPTQRGTVLYNGQNYYRHPGAFRTQLGYVPQDNIIHNDLTVERVLYYAARLRLPSDSTEEQINERIDAVLDDMEIVEQRGQMVSKLSGGQRKRVSIAVELLANPSIFFLDEPTSGLDPGLDRKMMLLLRKLADKGHTIILATHATNHINVCDYICFLARGGRLAYYGPPEGARAYFGKSDFAEIYSDLEPTKERPNVPAEVEARFRQSPEYARYITATLNNGPADHADDIYEQNQAMKLPRPANPWLQLRILVTRYLELLKNDRINLALLLLQAPIIGFLLLLLAGSNTFDQSNIIICPHHVNIMSNTGPVSNDCQQELQALNSLTTAKERAFKARRFPGKSDLQIVQDSITTGSGSSSQKILLIIVLAAVMAGCTNGAREIVKEAPIYRRERTVNLGILPYMFSKISVLGTLCVVQSFTLVLLVSLKAPFTHSIMLPPFLEIYISALLASLAGLMIGLTISAVVPNSDRALSIVPIVIVPQIIFSNVLFSLDNPPILQILGGIFPARWAMAAMGSTVGLHGDKLRTDGFSYRGTLLSLYSQSEAVFHLLLCWFMLLLMIVVLGIVIGLLLKKRDVRAWTTGNRKRTEARLLVS